MVTMADPLFERPPGGLWRLTSRLTARSRRQRFERFMNTVRPTAADSILDVGVTDTKWRSSNFLEALYPWPQKITALGLEPMPNFQRAHPEVRFVVGDGRALPFAEAAFDIGFSNAVIEHVGDRAQQRDFVGEMLRTCRRVFIATPNGRFPVDPHTLLPFVHWLPRRIRHPLLRLAGYSRWASEAALNPLDEKDFRAMFPPSVRVSMLRQRVLGLTTVLIAIAALDEHLPGQTSESGS
jgi:Methyltransferase domain